MALHHQAIRDAITDVSLKVVTCIHLKATSQEIHKISIVDISLTIASLR